MPMQFAINSCSPFKLTLSILAVSLARAIKQKRGERGR
jgi:hypothetical protein